MTARSAMYRVPADSLGSLSELGSGGQGKVYALSGNAPGLRALPYRGFAYAYKEYNRLARAALDRDVLEKMVSYAAMLTSGAEGLGDRLAWPLALVERDGAVSGFLMRRASPQFKVRMQLPSGPKQTLAEAQFLFNDAQYLADRTLPVHDRWRLQFLRDTAATLAQLHRSGIAVGDLSPKNLLVSFTTRPCCFFLDCDAMRIAGWSALPQVETTGWEIPVARRGISPDPPVRPPPIAWLPELDTATPRATTALPLERIRRKAGSATSARGPRPSRTSALNYLGKLFGIALAGFVALLVIIGVLAQLGPPGPTIPADPAAAYAELNRQVAADSPEVQRNLAERWVPQLASARKGLIVNGVTVDYTDILKEHRALRQQYPQARLVRSGDWSVFDRKDFFVTVLAIPYKTGKDANTWCDQQGIDRDHCFAKLLSQSKGIQGTTLHR